MKAFIQKGLIPADRLDDAVEHLRRFGYSVVELVPTTESLKALPVGPEAFVFGTLSVMLELIERAGLANRLLPTLPHPLRDLLHREVWEGRIDELLAGAAARQRPIFVKVANVMQRIAVDAFDSQVVASLDVVRLAPIIRPQTRILCSEPVSFVAEWRAYVRRAQVLEVFLYQPELPSLAHAHPNLLVDAEVAAVAAQAMERAGLATAGYAIDLGVTSTGKTTLIEVNDGIALANYGLDPIVHLDLHLARWQELVSGM